MSGRHCRRKNTFKTVIYYKHSKVKCQYCDITLDEQSATIDHFYPLDRGGADDFSNYRIACYRCNQIKSNEIHTFDPGCLLTRTEIELFKLVGHDLMKKLYQKQIIRELK